MTKKILTVLFMVLSLAFITGCSGYSADVDQTVIEQEGYLMLKTDKKLADCHTAGKSGYGGVGNDMFNYPAGQRTYSFTGTSSEAEIEPVPVVTADNQTLRIPGFVKFTLTADCEQLWEFHQKVGVKYGAYEQAGWNNFLNDYLAVAVTNALNDALGDENWQTLYQDADIRNGVSEELVESMQDQINSALGGEWITVNSVSISKPIASEDLVIGLEAAEKAKLENEAQKQRNTLAQTKYDSFTDCRRSGLTEGACLTIYLAETGQVPFYPIPQGSNLTVTPQAAQ